MAPQVGLEPTTLRLTAGCSAIELLRSVWRAEAHLNISIVATSGGSRQSGLPMSRIEKAIKKGENKDRHGARSLSNQQPLN